MQGPRILSLSLQRQCRMNVSCRGTASGIESQPTNGLNPMAKAALTSGALSMLGDVCAQLLPQRNRIGKSGLELDWVRMARMASFGLFFYGPYQYKWYGELDRRWPSSRGLTSFLAKVTLNQVALSPVVLAVVFAWNLGLTGQSNKIEGKIRNDLVPTMINGWKFWVPAASVNFAVVPLHHQVLYMSLCSVLWTAYLSHASNTKAVAEVMEVK